MENKHATAVHRTPCSDFVPLKMSILEYFDSDICIRFWKKKPLQPRKMEIGAKILIGQGWSDEIPAWSKSFASEQKEVQMMFIDCSKCMHLCRWRREQWARIASNKAKEHFILIESVIYFILVHIIRLYRAQKLINIYSLSRDLMLMLMLECGLAIPMNVRSLAAVRRIFSQFWYWSILRKWPDPTYGMVKQKRKKRNKLQSEVDSIKPMHRNFNFIQNSFPHVLIGHYNHFTKEIVHQFTFL